MSTKHLLRSFAGGEITPELAGRLDLTKYQTGLALCRNFITLPHGPATRRPGTEYIAQVKDSTRKVRLIPFTFSADQTAVLEFGHEYIRVHINGGALLEANKTIESIFDNEVEVASHGYVGGDWVFIGGKFFVVDDDVVTDYFRVSTLAGEPGAPAGDSVARVFTLETPYQEEDLFDIHFAQSGDVVTLTHPNYPASELSRQSAFEWTLTEVDFGPPAGVPTGVVATPTVAENENKTTTKYVVTAVADDGVTETLPSAPALAVNNLTLAGNYNTITWNPINGYSRYNVYKLRGGVYGYIGQVSPTRIVTGFIGGLINPDGGVKDVATATPYQDIGFFKFGRVRVVTTAAHGFTTGDSVYLDGTGYFDGLFAVTVENSTTFTYAKVTQFSAQVTTGVAYVPSLSLVDDNVQADTTQSPPEDIVSLNKGPGDYPSTTVYHEQRRWFAGTIGKPQVLWATRVGADSNLTSSIPTRDADGMEVRIASSQYNQIRHVVALSDLIVLTAGGEFRVYSENAPSITPTSISIKPQGYSGASNVQPVVTSGTIMYVQAQGSRIRELSYSWEANAYKTVDASLMAPHRFNYHTVVDMAFGRSPEQILWAVRDDGLLLGMTYVPEQQVYGWHAHDTDGKFESVTSVPEGNEDMLYAVVSRRIGERDVRYIERLGTRYFSQLSFSGYVDCRATYTDSKRTTQIQLEQVKILQSEVDFDTDTWSCIYHYRKVGNQVWVFQDTDTSTTPGVETPKATIKIFDQYYNAVDLVEVQDIDIQSSWGQGGYSLTETDTHFYLWGLNTLPSGAGICVRVAKADPHDQRTVANEADSMVAFPANDGTSAWMLLQAGPHTFKRWSYASESFVETRYGMNTPGNWIPGIFSVLHLENGDIAYTDYSSSDGYSRVVFVRQTGGIDYIELDADQPVACMKVIDGHLWALTSDKLFKINPSTRLVAASYPVDGCFSGAGTPADMGYHPTERTLYWFHNPQADPVDPKPMVVSFDLSTNTQVGKRSYVPDNDTIGEYLFGMDYVDGYILASGNWAKNIDGETRTGYSIFQLSRNENPLLMEVLDEYSFDMSAPGSRFVVFDTVSGERYDYTVLRQLSVVRYLVEAQRETPSAYYDVPITEWYAGVATTISGLDHLEGATVQILADGAVHPERVVQNGSITLEYPAAIVTVGLKYTSDLKTLPLAIEGAQAAGQGTMKNVNRVHLRVSQSSLVAAGPTFDRLRDYPARSVSDAYGAPPALRDGELELSVDPSWNTDAAVCVRQDQPLPLTVVSMALEVKTGG